MNSTEYLATTSACMLLMPEENFHKAILTGTRKISELSKLFGVPSEAVRLRAKQLGYRIKETKPERTGNESNY